MNTEQSANKEMLSYGFASFDPDATCQNLLMERLSVIEDGNGDRDALVALILQELGKCMGTPVDGEEIALEPMLARWIQCLCGQGIGAGSSRQLDLLRHRFEVTKCLYPVMTKKFLVGRGSCRKAELYALFALALLLRSEQTGAMNDLNSALKACDLLARAPWFREARHVAIIQAALQLEALVLKGLVSRMGESRETV